MVTIRPIRGRQKRWQHIPYRAGCQENRVNVRWIVSAAGALSDDNHGRPNWKLCIDPIYIIRINRLWQLIPLKDYWYRSGTTDIKNQSFFISYKWYRPEQSISKMGYQSTLKTVSVLVTLYEILLPFSFTACNFLYTSSFFFYCLQFSVHIHLVFYKRSLDLCYTVFQ
jgi:hypothetical protein